LKPQRAGSERLDPTVWKIAAVVLLGPLMAQIDSTVVNFSLSAIRQDLHSSLDAAQWIVSGYLLALALMLPLNGWLVDRVGVKRLYLACFSAFTLVSLLCGLARTMDALISARIIQGMAGGLLAPMTQLMLARIAGKHFARVMGYAAMPILLAPILGPVLAGAILKYASWPWLFYINLPIGLLAVGLAIILLPVDAAAIQRRPFDFVGFLLIAPALASLLYGLDHAAGPEHNSHRAGVLALLAGLALGGAFIRRALHKKNAALIDLRLFTNSAFAMGSATQVLSQGAMYAAQLLLPLYLIAGCDLSATTAGWILLSMGIGMLCSFPLMGFLTERFGARSVATSGALLVFLSTLPILWMIENQFSQGLMAACLFARGVGHGAIGIPSLSAAYASVQKEKLALATTAMNIVQRLGGPIATTVIAMVLARSASRVSSAGPQSFVTAFGVLLGLQFFVLAAAWSLPAQNTARPHALT
jgi:EmrB/QacA subfamily drug resistance transporter